MNDHTPKESLTVQCKEKKLPIKNGMKNIKDVRNKGLPKHVREVFKHLRHERATAEKWDYIVTPFEARHLVAVFLTRKPILRERKYKVFLGLEYNSYLLYDGSNAWYLTSGQYCGTWFCLRSLGRLLAEHSAEHKILLKKIRRRAHH